MKTIKWSVAFVIIVIVFIMLGLYSCSNDDDDDDAYCKATCRPESPIDCVMSYGEFGHACSSDGCCDPEKSDATHDEVSAFWYYIENDFLPEIKEIKCAN